MQNVHAVYRPTFHVLDNAALVFGVTLILYYIILYVIKLFSETVLAFKLQFYHLEMNL